MIEVPYNYNVEKIIDLLKRGIFMITKSADDINIMTIGWCLIGYMWNRPIFQMIVRTSRYSYKIIEKANSFSVNIPLSDNYNKEILFCGTHSKRNIDKFKECNFDVMESMSIESPIIKGCDQYYECKIIAKSKLPIERIGNDDFNENGSDNCFHVMYYGEIMKSYKI